MRNRESGSKAAEKRAERVGWRPQRASQASRTMDERLRELSDRSAALDVRLRRHAEETAGWHKEWDASRPT